MLDNIMRQFDHAADIIGLNPNIRKILEVMSKLEKKLKESFSKILERAKNRKVDVVQRHL